MLVAISLLPFLSPVVAPQDQDDTVAAIRAATSEALKSNRALMIAVVHEGKVILAEAVGRLGGDKKATARTLFPLGQASRAVSSLVFSRMHAARQLDFGRMASDCVQDFTLRDEKGAPSKATLADVLFDRVDLPDITNYLPAQQLQRWTAERAVRDHAIVIAEGNLSMGLNFAFAQCAAELAGRRSWQDIVRRHVSKPLGLTSLVADVREGLPDQAAPVFREGLFGLPTQENSGHGAIASATGAWANAADVAMLMQELLGLSKGVTKNEAVRALVSERIEFAGFDTPPVFEDDVGKKRHTWLEIVAGAPGMCGGLYLFPQYQTGWAVFVNERSQVRGIPPKLRSLLTAKLLPDPTDGETKSNAWIGGGFGGRFGGRRAASKPFSEAQQGTWKGVIRIHGKPLPLRMEVGPKQVGSIRLDEARPRRTLQTRHRGNRVTFRTKGLLPLREDRSLSYLVEIVWVDGAEPSWWGRVQASSRDYCDLTFPVTFRKAEKK